MTDNKNTTVPSDEQIDGIARKYAGMGGVEDYRSFARDVLKAFRGATSTTEASVPTWQERSGMREFIMPKEAVPHMLAEISDLRAQLAAKGQGDRATIALHEAAAICDSERYSCSNYAGACADAIRRVLIPKYTSLAPARAQPDRRAAQPADVGAPNPIARASEILKAIPDLFGEESPQAAQGVKTWFDRAAEHAPGTNPQHWSAVFKAAWMLEEIADLRAQLASAQQAKEYEQRHAAESEKALAQVHSQLVRQSQGNRLLPREVFASDDAYAAYLQEWAAPPLSSEQQANFRSLVQSIVHDGYLSDTNMARGRAALDATDGEQQAEKGESDVG